MSVTTVKHITQASKYIEHSIITGHNALPFSKMRSQSILVPLLAFAAAVDATKVVLTNDDGWAVAQIRAQKNALTSAGFDVRSDHSELWTVCVLMIPIRSYSQLLLSTSQGPGHLRKHQPSSPRLASIIHAQLVLQLKVLMLLIVSGVIHPESPSFTQSHFRSISQLCERLPVRGTI